MFKIIVAGAAAIALGAGATAAPKSASPKADHCRTAKEKKTPACATSAARAAGAVVKSKSNISNNRSGGH